MHQLVLRGRDLALVLAGREQVLVPQVQVGAVVLDARRERLVGAEVQEARLGDGQAHHVARGALLHRLAPAATEKEFRVDNANMTEA